MLFSVLALLQFPLAMMYNQFDYFDYDAKISQMLGFSLGNLGFSETHCLIESMIQSNTSEILDSD